MPAPGGKQYMMHLAGPHSYAIRCVPSPAVRDKWEKNTEGYEETREDAVVMTSRLAGWRGGANQYQFIGLARSQLHGCAIPGLRTVRFCQPDMIATAQVWHARVSNPTPSTCSFVRHIAW